MTSTLLPFQPNAMTPAQLAAVSYLARYTGHTHTLHTCQLRRWFTWCQNNALDVPGHQVGSSRLMGGRHASAL